MGTWHIHIEGHGVHHNGRVDDAEVLAKNLVDDLEAQGHKISRAEFTLTGSQSDLKSGEVLAR